MMADTELGTECLEELDFPVPCGHSCHSPESPWHDDGAAEYIAASHHDCPAEPEKARPYYYPCCAQWAQFVLRCTAEGRMMRCARCRQTAYWSDVVTIEGTLT
jgi:hypothetical protein